MVHQIPLSPIASLRANVDSQSFSTTTRTTVKPIRIPSNEILDVTRGDVLSYLVLEDDGTEEAISSDVGSYRGIRGACRLSRSNSSEE